MPEKQVKRTEIKKVESEQKSIVQSTKKASLDDAGFGPEPKDLKQHKITGHW